MIALDISPLANSRGHTFFFVPPVLRSCLGPDLDRGDFIQGADKHRPSGNGTLLSGPPLTNIKRQGHQMEAETIHSLPYRALLTPRSSFRSVLDGDSGDPVLNCSLTSTDREHPGGTPYPFHSSVLNGVESKPRRSSPDIL